VTLVVLRIREPEVEARFRVPGGLVGASLLGVFPLLLLGLAGGRTRQRNRLGDEWVGVWFGDYCGGVCGVFGDG